MNNRVPWDITATDVGGKTAPAAGTKVVRRLIVVMLLATAALDLTRCGLVLTAARHPLPTAGLVVAGLAAAALTARTARGCQAGRRWAGWVALLIAAASVPQAAASGFRSPYRIPDSATAALGILLATTILATAGRMGRRDVAPRVLLSFAPRSRAGACDGGMDTVSTGVLHQVESSVVAVQLTRQHVVDVLHKAGLPEMADEALRDLPDPVDSEQVAVWAGTVRHQHG